MLYLDFVFLLKLDSNGNGSSGIEKKTEFTG